MRINHKVYLLVQSFLIVNASIDKGVSVVIPTYNEEGCIGSVLKEMPKEKITEILIIDGNSTDNTVKEVEEAGYSVLRQNGKGYGSAFKEGIEKSKGEIIVLMDGDGSHNPQDLPKLVDIVNQNPNTIAIASRYTHNSGTDDDTFIRGLGNKFFTWFTNFRHNLGVSDALFLYAAFPKDAFEKIQVNSEDFAYCIEVLIKAKKAGYQFIEIPSIERARFAGESKVSAIKHGWRIFVTILRG